MLDKTDLISTT